MKSYELTDEQWKRIEPLMPVKTTGKKGRPRKDDRTMLNAMLWITRSGAQWRLLPKEYGPWQSVYARFAKWRDSGIWKAILQVLVSDADKENLSIDSTSIRVHESSNGQKKTKDKAIGRSRGGLTTKIHAIVDGLGNPVQFLLSPGNDHDSIHAVELLEKVPIKGSNILGDRAYGSQNIRAYITNQGASYTIPPQSNASNPWPVDWWLYKERHLVECFFQKIKWFRRVATRYDKLDSSFLAFVHLAAIIIWLL